MDSVDKHRRLAWVTDQLANGNLPDGPPSSYKSELAEVDRRHAALRGNKDDGPPQP